MATPSLIEVSVDSAEYCRYEEDKSTITVTLAVTGGAPYTSEDILVELIKARRARDAVVASTTVTVTASTDPQEVTCTFYLPDIVDQDEISLIRFGNYFVRATSQTDPSIFGDSSDFAISVISVEAFKREYLFGLDLKATEILRPHFQPQTISGVTITEVSKGHPVGFGLLVYNYTVDNISDASATIGSGTDGTVTVTAIGSFAGSFGNSLAVEVLVPAGTSALTTTYSAGTLTVSLATVSGVPDDPANTATLIATSISAVTGFSAVPSGTGASSLTAVEGPTQFAGGTSSVVRLLSWKSGTSVSVNKPGSYILKAGSTYPGMPVVSNPEYVVVKIPSVSLLPAASTAEEILIDKDTMDDSSLRSYIKEAIAWVENDYLCTHIEPTNVTTDRDPTTVQFSVGINSGTPLFADSDFDFIVPCLTYFRPQHGVGWIHINTPYTQILRVDSLFGAIANTRVIEIDLEWIEESKVGGIIQLVPFSQEVAMDFIGLVWTNSLRGASELPNFWHFNAIVGLRNCPADVLELVGRQAAIKALTAAGLAVRPGVGSLSLSRDGVSQSVSYITSSKYGLYTPAIQAHQDWMENHGKELKAKYRGLTWAIV